MVLGSHQFCKVQTSKVISGLWPVTWICIFDYIIIQLYSVIWILPFADYST